MILFVTLVILSVILTLIYFLGRYNEYYWKKRGAAFYNKNRVTGVMWDYFTSDQALFLCLHDLYKVYRREPAVGLGAFTVPALYAIDIENVQHVLQNDFHSFNHRGTEFSPDDKLADHVLFQSGDRWRLMRHAMTPLFTNHKLKNMYYIIDKCAQDFVQYLIKDPSKQTGDIFDTLNDFCSAAVGGAVFGITTQTIFNSPFVQMSKQAFSPTLMRNFIFVLANLKHDIMKILRYNLFTEFEDFFIGAIKQVLRQREKEGVGNRHDFADLAVTLQKVGKLVDQETGFELEMTDEILAAQAFFFYVAGVEPTATAIYSTLIELGQRPEIMEKVVREIDEAWERSKGTLTFDIVKDMEYLDKVLDEALRMYPPIGFLTRRAIRSSVLPVGNIKVEAGTKVFTPVFEIHHDPEYYPNPEEFDPERFSAENKRKLENVYMPFGRGGRLCIGMRYARLQAKAGIIHMLRHFRVKTTILPGGIKYSKKQVQVRPTNVKLDLIPRIG